MKALREISIWEENRLVNQCEIGKFYQLLIKIIGEKYHGYNRNLLIWMWCK